MLYSISNPHDLGDHAHVKEVMVFILEDPEEFQSLKKIFPWMDLQEALTPYNHPLCEEILRLRHFYVISNPGK